MNSIGKPDHANHKLLTDMIRLCREAGLAEPEFSIRDGFVATIWRSTSGKPSGKRLGKTAGAIVNEMRENPQVTISELATMLNRSERAIELQINKLRESAIIARIGPARGGHWEVTEGGDE